MTREEFRDYVDFLRSQDEISYDVYSGLIDGIDTLEQELSRDMEEIEEVINCDADAETKCKMISNILTAKPHYFEKQEVQKNEDKQTMLIKFTKDFANNWKTGDVVKAKYLEKGEVLVDDVAKIHIGLLLEHCKIISESEERNE